MARYRKKPVVVDAFRMGIDPRPDWFQDAVTSNKIITRNVDGDMRGGVFGFARTECLIETLEGQHKGDYGDYIIRGVKGEIYPCKPDIFELTYEAVPEATNGL